MLSPSQPHFWERHNTQSSWVQNQQGYWWLSRATYVVATGHRAACSPIHRTFLRWDRQKVNIQTILKSVNERKFWSVLYSKSINVVYVNTCWVLLCMKQVWSEKWPADTNDHLMRGLSSVYSTQVGHRTYLSQPMQQWLTTLCLGRFYQTWCYSTWVLTRGKLPLHCWWQCSWINSESEWCVVSYLTPVSSS